MKKNEDELLKSIVTVSTSISPSVLLSVANALETLTPAAGIGNPMAISNLAPHPSSRNDLKQLLQFWADSCPDVGPGSLAWALKSASAMNEHHRNTQSLELVWTGPSQPPVQFRRTDQALYEIIDQARHTILLATFAAYKTPDLDRAILRAIDRGVSITMILESSEVSDGKMGFGAFERLRESLAEKVSVYVWPLEKREHDTHGNYGSLHVKCAVADERSALISSANLTGFALSLNMELGILIRGGEVPQQIHLHFHKLIENETLVLT